MSYTYESVKDRILQYILYKGITKKEFEQNSGLSNGYLNSLRDKPSETKLQSIYKAYPDINPVWLLSGVGNMLADISASSVDTSSNSSSVDLNRNERFKYLVAMLKKGGYIRNQKDLGIMMGYNNESAFSQVINGKAVEPKDFTERLKVLFPIINVGWLNCGDGDVFISEGDQNPSAVVDTSDPPPEGTKQVHYFPDIEATGGNKQLFEDNSERAISLAIPRNFDADFALPLAGDSMTPLYQPGSIILVKRWQERFIEYGKVYLIITTQGNRMVKYLRAAERNEEVLCVSENSAYDPFTIPREDILALYMVKGCIFQHSL